MSNLWISLKRFYRYRDGWSRTLYVRVVIVHLRRHDAVDTSPAMDGMIRGKSSIF